MINRQIKDSVQNDNSWDDIPNIFKYENYGD